MADKFFFPNKGFMRLPTVLKVIPVGKSTWWAGVKSGRFPKPVKLGKRASAWRADEIQALIQLLNQTQQSYISREPALPKTTANGNTQSPQPVHSQTEVQLEFQNYIPVGNC